MPPIILLTDRSLVPASALEIFSRFSEVGVEPSKFARFPMATFCSTSKIRFRKSCFSLFAKLEITYINTNTMNYFRKYFRTNPDENFQPVTLCVSFLRPLIGLINKKLFQQVFLAILLISDFRSPTLLLLNIDYDSFL